jgi:hypothetical protein
MSEDVIPFDQERFFTQIVERLPDQLPTELRNFEARIKLDKGMLCIRFPMQTGSQYELCRAQGNSQEVIAYFKNDQAEILGLFYKSRPKDLVHWLKIMLPRLPEFRRMMRKPVLAGPWGKRGAFVGMDLSGWKLDNNPELYARIVARFIEATFSSAVQGLNASDEPGT